MALSVTACGGGAKPKGPSPAQDRNQVLARTLVQRVAGAGLPCETALRLGLGTVRQPRLQVATIKVNGNHALAQVYSGAADQKASSDVVQLVREGGSWRVASLAGPQPPAPPRSVDTP